MLDGVKRFANVNGNRRSTERRLLLVETRGDASDGRKKGSGGGVLGAEAMLGGGRGERGSNKRED